MNLNDLLDQSAAANSGALAFVSQNSSITYGELRRAVLETAGGFAKRGVGPGHCVAIIHRNSQDFVIAYLALNRLGAIGVPINFMIQKAEELAYMLKDCGAVGVVSQKEFLKGVRAAVALAPTVKTLWVTDVPDSELKKGEEWFSRLRQFGDSFPARTVSESDVAAILYTSGTTGSPKGVMLTHRNLVTNADAAIKVMRLKKSDVGLCILPMFHSFAWTGCVLVPLRLGTKAVISPAITPAKPWLKLMASHGVTLFAAVPQLYAVLAKEVTGLKGLVMRYWFFRKVRLAISGAAPLSPTVQKAFEKALGVPIVEGYGLTETSPVATINVPSARRRGSVGPAVQGVQLKIIDDAEKTLATGEEGEICIKGENVMKGYYNLPAETKAAFTKDGWFKTGDVGALDEKGYLYIRDRKKDMIIVKGLKVFSAQVEASLLEHPSIEEAAIIGVPDETGDEVIKAFLVLRKDSPADKAALMKFCKEKFDPYKRPRDVEIVESLPKNALQKVLKRVLRDREMAKRDAGAPPPQSGRKAAA